MINQYIETFKTFKIEIFGSLFETLDMMFTAMCISLIIGLFLGFVLFITGSNGIYKDKTIYFIISGLINITRSIPFILFIIVIIPLNRLILGTGFGVDASKIPLSFIGIAIFSRFIEQDLLDVNKNIYETSYALGASTIQYFIHFLLKEARSGLVLSFTSTIISLLSYSTVMGIIGGGGLGYLAISEGYYNFNYKLMWIIIVMMILIVQIIQTSGNIIANKIDKR
ncbi:ABC transporter permease subunit [Tissierella sp.]|uniref:methionine ABC transporter permease n=1 Tax=Tissierella sp. TaxID=41274 RepID=UPI002863F032|nr:ABC transporter permease subunit [Tissierella sp.]MDR7855230.1 ABC transporter permease subunit [Tissierella sp.]